MNYDTWHDYVNKCESYDNRQRVYASLRYSQSLFYANGKSQENIQK